MDPKFRHVKVTIGNRTIIRILLIIIASFLLLKAIAHTEHVLELIFVSFFLSLSLNPAVSWIARHLKSKSRALATGVAYLIVVIVLAGFLSLVVPPLVSQTVDFVRSLPQTLSSLQSDNSTAGHLVQRYHLQDQVNGLAGSIQEHTRNLQQPVITTATRVGSTLISILTVLVLTFMMLVEGPEWIEKIWALPHIKDRQHKRELAQRMYRVVTGYVNGQVILAVIGAALGLIALVIAGTLLHASVNVLALAGILFITGLIPLIGHLIGAVIVVVACLFVSLPLAIIMAIFLLLHQEIENVTLQPYIQAKYNELTPLLVFVAALVGIGLAGLLGAFVAIPAAGCLKILIQDHLARHTKRLKTP